MDELHRHYEQRAQRIADLRQPSDFAFNFTPQEQAIDLRPMTIDEQIEACKELVEDTEDLQARTRALMAVNDRTVARLKEMGLR
jgi:hypothetical protein